MKNKLNKKFIVILASSLLVIFAGVAVVAFVAIRGDAERQARIGRLAEAEGDYREAMSRFVRAIGKDPTNLSYFDEYERALLKITPETGAEARDLYLRRYLGLLNQRIGISQDNPESLRRLIEAYRERALLLAPANEGDLWRLVQEEATRMLETFPDQPAVVDYARSVRLDAMSRRLDLLKSNEELVFEMDRDAALEQELDQPLAWQGILRAQYEKARDYWSRNDERRLLRELGDSEYGFDTILDRMQALAIDRTPVVMRLQLLRDTLNEERDEELRQEVLESALADTRQLIAGLNSAPTPEKLLALEAELRFMVTANVIPPSEIQELIRPLVEDGLLPLDMNLMMAQVFVLSDPEFSTLSAEAVLDEGPLTVGLFSTIQPLARSEAALILFDTEFGRISAEAGALEGDDLDTSDLNAYRELVLDEYVGDPRLPIIDLYTRGSISLLEGKTELARANFMEIKDDEFFQQRGMFERFIPRLVSAATLSGERGIAVEVLSEFLESVPIEMAGSLRLTYAQELLRLGQAQEAARQVDAVLATNPTDERALLLKQDVTNAASAVGSFVRTTQNADQRLLQRARSSLRDGNLEDARTLLESIIQDNDDIAFKRLLVSVNAQLGFVDEINKMIAANPEMTDDPDIARILTLLEISDPIERIMVTSESTYETDSEINANRLLALLRLALTDSDARDRARALLEETLALVVADPPLDSTVRSSLLRNALRYDIRSGLLNSPEAYGDRIFAAISAVEDSEVSLANMQATLQATIGQPRETLGILQPLIDRNIANDESMLIQALAYRDLGRNDDSIDALQVAYDRSPDNITYIKLLASWLTERGDTAKALDILRKGVRSPLTRGPLMNDWLVAESTNGQAASALQERLAIYQSDIADGAGQVNPVYDFFNAVELSRLLLTVPPSRSEILDSRGRVRYSPVAWGGLSQSARGKVLREARADRSEEAFKILTDMERAARNDRDVIMVKYARIRANALANQLELARLGVNSLVECCNTMLSTGERANLITLMASLDMNEEAIAQVEILAADEQVANRRLAYRLGSQLGWDGSFDLVQAIAGDSTDAQDKLLLVEGMLQASDLEGASAVLEECSSMGEFDRSPYLEAQLRFFEADIYLRRSEQLLEQAAAINATVSSTSISGGAVPTELLNELRETRRLAKLELQRSIESADASAALQPSSISPMLVKHVAYQRLFEMNPEPALQADLVENARRAVELEPLGWPANELLAKALVITGRQRDALTTVSQYLIAGGDSPLARQLLYQVALSSGAPGQAVPSMKVAMEKSPMDPGWPRTIARLLSAERDHNGASDMWWKALALDDSEQSIKTFVELELRREKPNLSRLQEAFEMNPGVTQSSPEMRSAMAAVLALSGDTRKADRAFKDAYLLAKGTDSAEDRIAIDRVLVYFFKMQPEASLEQMEASLRLMSDGEMGAHEYGALASQALARSQEGESPNLAQAISYLKQAVSFSNSEIPYQKSLLQNLSTALFLEGNCDEAIRVLEDLVALGDAPASTYNNLAYMLVDCQGEAEKALEYSSIAVEAASNDASLLDTHGFILFQLGRLEDARMYLSRSVVLRESPANLLHLAQVLDALGDKERAALVVEKIGNNYPQLPPKQQKTLEEIINNIG